MLAQSRKFFVISTMVICPMLVLANDLEKKLEMTGALPFADNPFFAKTVAISGQFDGNGTEGVDPVWGGYECRWIGNLNCTDEDFVFQCEGGGVVDCTGE